MSAVHVIVTSVSLATSRINKSSVHVVVGMFHEFKHAELVTLRLISSDYTRLELVVSVIVYVNVYEPMSLSEA